MDILFWKNMHLASSATVKLQTRITEISVSSREAAKDLCAALKNKSDDDAISVNVGLNQTSCCRFYQPSCFWQPPLKTELVNVKPCGFGRWWFIKGFFYCSPARLPSKLLWDINWLLVTFALCLMHRLHWRVSTPHNQFLSVTPLHCCCTCCSKFLIFWTNFICFQFFGQSDFS